MIYADIWVIYVGIWVVYADIWVVYADIWVVYVGIWVVYVGIWVVYVGIWVIYVGIRVVYVGIWATNADMSQRNKCVTRVRVIIWRVIFAHWVTILRQAMARDAFDMKFFSPSTTFISAGCAVALFGTLTVNATAQPTTRTKIFFVSNRDGNNSLWAADADGANPTEIFDNASEPALSRDGTRLAFSQGGEIFIAKVSVNGSGAVELKTLGDAPGATRLTNDAVVDAFPSFSSDGSRLIFQRGPVANVELALVNTDGSGTVSDAFNRTGRDNAPRFVTNSQIVFARRPDASSDVSLVSFILNTGGSPTIEEAGTGNSNVGRLAVSPTSSEILYTRPGGPNFGLYRKTLGSAGTPINSSLPGDDFPAFSNDGLKIIFSSTAASRNTAGGPSDVLVMNANGTGIVNLTGNAANDFAPVIGEINLVGTLAEPTGAAGLVVTTNADVSAIDGLISLREAIINANGNADSSTVTFASNVRGSIDLTSTLPPFTTPVTVTGPGAALLAVNRLSSAAAFRLFTVTTGSSRIQNLTLSGGLATGSGDNGLDGTGGAVLVRSGTVLSLNSVVVTGNSALGGGAVENFGTLVVGDSTFSGNTATLGTGGAIHSTPAATSFSVNNSTFVGNRSADSGGAIRADTAGTFNSLTVANNFADSDQNGSGVGGGLNLAGGTLINSLVVGNIVGASTSGNVAGTASTTSFNRITGTVAAAGLEVDGAGAPVLKLNGGTTPTVALLVGSAALNAGSTTLNFDQRGIARPQGANDDIGAFEFNTPLVLSVTRLDQNPATGGSVRFRVDFSVSVLGVGPEDFAIATTGNLSGASVTGVTGNGAVYTVTVGGISGTGTLRLDVLAGAGITDSAGGSFATGFNRGDSYTRNEGAGATPATSGAIISEFRHRGAGGSGDEYVELVNTTNAALEIGGWSVQTSAGTTFVPQNTSIPAFGHYLLTGGAYSLGTYGAGDALLSGDASEASGVALFSAVGTVQDAVGFAASPTIRREGAGLPGAFGSDSQHAFMRDFSGGFPKDSGNSSNDFVLLTPTSAGVAANSALGAQLGAPNPEALLSPTNFNASVSVNLLQPEAGLNNTPNRVRTGSGNEGTLLLRRTIRNNPNSGRAITRLRLIVTRITSQGSAAGTVPAPATQADVRLISSGNESISYPTRDAGGNLTGTTTSATIVGTLLEAPSVATSTSGIPIVTAGGGGLGSSVAFDVSLPTPLQPGQSANYGFNLQVAKGGTYLVAFNILALTTDAAQ